LTATPPEHLADAIPVADVYGFSTYTTTYHRTLEILQIAQRVNRRAWTVAGGPHASALPEQVAHDFDFVIVKEGETALLNLVRTLTRGESPRRILNEAPLADLDLLPFPDYSLVNVSSYRRVVDGKPSLSILSSRGCPYRCVFCNSIVMGGHQRVRFRSATNVVAEIQQLKAAWGVTSFRFQDDILTINLPRLRELTTRLSREAITYRCFGRADLCTREVVDLLREGGCRHIAFGIESGSQFILNRMRKGLTIERIRQGIAAARAAGLIVRVYLMVGFPGETWQTIQETVDLMLECAPDEFAVYPLIPYPGTPLYQNPAEYGITYINPEFSQYFQVRRERGTGFVFRTADLDENLIADMRAYLIERLEPTIVWAGESKNFK
jgi:radical SAM superfamily enzyme YgiQ (UPF0313 family)